MKVTCPKSTDHKKFLTVAHVMEEWLVDETGDFIDVNQCLQTSFSPDPGNIWTCAECGSEAEVEG
jgi:hypothetical protein